MWIWYRTGRFNGAGQGPLTPPVESLSSPLTGAAAKANVERE